MIHAVEQIHVLKEQYCKEEYFILFLLTTTLKFEGRNQLNDC